MKPVPYCDFHIRLLLELSQCIAQEFTAILPEREDLNSKRFPRTPTHDRLIDPKPVLPKVARELNVDD